MTRLIQTKLGELLVREKVITAEQLEDVLAKQTLYGTRLGSSIVEMGYAEEERLIHLLGEKLGVPVAGRKELYTVSNELVSLLSRELAFKYHVIPFKLERNRLCIAMSDPTDLKAIDEIAFITGYVVLPHIALDVHVSRAMAKYYRISSKEMQYRQMSDQRKKDQGAIPAPAAEISIPNLTEDRQWVNVAVPVSFEGFSAMGEPVSDDFAAEAEDPLTDTLAILSRKFAAAVSRDQIADLFSAYLAREFAAGGMFIIRGSIAVGWRGVSGGEKLAGFTDLNFILSKPSVLKDVVESRQASIATVVDTPQNRQLLIALNLGFETALLALPLVMMNKVVAVILAAGEISLLELRLAELQRIVRKAALAFEMLIIKNKIMLS